MLTLGTVERAVGPIYRVGDVLIGVRLVEGAAALEGARESDLGGRFDRANEIELTGVSDDLLHQRGIFGHVERDVQPDFVELADDRFGDGFVIQVAPIGRVEGRFEAVRKAGLGE